MRPVPFWHDLGHQRRVLGRNVLVVERDELLEAEHLAIELDPLIHLAFFDVADDVVDGCEADRVRRCRAVAFRVDGRKARREHAAIAIAIDEAVRRVAVRLDRRCFVNAEFVLESFRIANWRRPASDRGRERAANVGHVHGDVHDTVAVRDEALAVRMFLPQRRNQHERDFALAQHVAGFVRTFVSRPA